MSKSIVSTKPNPALREAEVERLRTSITAIHLRLITADLTKDSIVQIIRECEFAIPDLRSIREHAWTNHVQIDSKSEGVQSARS